MADEMFFVFHQRYDQLVLRSNINVNRIVLSQLRMLCDSEETGSYKVGSITVTMINVFIGE